MRASVTASAEAGNWPPVNAAASAKVWPRVKMPTMASSPAEVMR